MRFVTSVCFCLTLGVASASSSFQGTFLTDDQVQFFSFTLASTATVTLQTFSYAGGTNANSVVIPGGGFDPILTVFDSTGKVEFSDNDGTCAQVGDGAGGCLDSYLQLVSLAAGTYTLALTENDNEALGPNLSNGFSEAGNGDFTGSEFGCGNGVFCDAAGDSQDGNWAVDIVGATSASPSGAAVPEPGTLGLLVAGFGGLLLKRRKTRQ
jgi:PEP-CTERM motif